MGQKRKVEVFSAGCPACEPTVQLVKSLACPSCDVQVLNMNSPDVAAKAKQYGVTSVPAVVINGKLADCCSATGPEEATLRTEGLGVAL
jgi:glutaredoxin 3